MSVETMCADLLRLKPGDPDPSIEELAARHDLPIEKVATEIEDLAWAAHLLGPGAVVRWLTERAEQHAAQGDGR